MVGKEILLNGFTHDELVDILKGCHSNEIRLLISLGTLEHQQDMNDHVRICVENISQTLLSVWDNPGDTITPKYQDVYKWEEDEAKTGI